jgi:Domain of unknown function (DUF4412)
MKKIIARFILLLASTLFIHAGTVKAQFFKGILNSVKETAEGRANSKASQTTNKTLDKVDSSTRISTNHTSPGGSGGSGGSNQEPRDSSATNSVLGAFAKAAAANPNDTSSADLTMKALGILAGETAVSPKDSADAINTYKTSTGGAGMHYEYSFTTSGKKIATNKDTSHIYFTNGGEGRSEMSIPMPGVKTNQMISVGRINEPKYTVFLYPDSKTYSLRIVDTSMLKSKKSYQVTKIGTETVQGYSCIHAKIVSSGGSGRFKSTSTMDIWTSTAVPGYSLYKKMTDLRASEIGMLSALEKAGCSGIFVKLVVTGNDVTVEEVLLKAEERNYSADLFRIPTGYTQSNENMIYHMAASPKK